MAAAIALAQRGTGRTGTNPAVGCILVKDERVVGRGWTQPGGRPHAEAMALDEAGFAAESATAYVSLEPCAHVSERGPSCADLLVAAKVARVVAALADPDSRTAGKGFDRLQAHGIAVEQAVQSDDARQQLAGFLSRIEKGRPHVTLKLATSLDGCIAMADGSSRWITGAAARAHGHLERARCDAILVGAGTYAADNPRLDVRLPGLENRSPRRFILTSGQAPDGWEKISTPDAIASLDCNYVLIEGGAQTAAAFIAANLVDRLLLYRAPILIGNGKACLTDIGLNSLEQAHGRWNLIDSRLLGPKNLAGDRVEVYEATPCSQA